MFLAEVPLQGHHADEGEQEPPVVPQCDELDAGEVTHLGGFESNDQSVQFFRFLSRAAGDG